MALIVIIIMSIHCLDLVEENDNYLVPISQNSYVELGITSKFHLEVKILPNMLN